MRLGTVVVALGLWCLPRIAVAEDPEGADLRLSCDLPTAAAEDDAGLELSCVQPAVPVVDTSGVQFSYAPYDVPAEHEVAVPDDAALEASGAVIGTITIDAGSIFDPEKPGEDKAVFRAANKLHRTTRERVIRRELTFRPGDPYSRSALDESERHLRHVGYLYDAVVRPTRYDGHAVDILVSTRDVWTLRPAAGFKRNGGVNTFHFGLHDANFLGLGKRVEIERVNGIDRTETGVSYFDRGLAGTHAKLELGYSNNSDGTASLLALERPFWRRDESWGAGIRGEDGDRIDPLYALGEVTSRYHLSRTLFAGWFGHRVGGDGPTVKRLLAGFTFDRSLFDPTPETTVLPQDRTLSYPWIGMAFIHEGYIKAHDMDKLGRTEDFDLGRELEAQIGWSSPSFGADRNAAIVSLTGRLGASPGRGQVFTFDASTTGRIASSGVEDGRLDATARYYHREGDRRLFYAAVTGSASSNADADHQILLGGDNGLRGYPLRYATGDRSLLLTLEERFYLDREFFHLVRFGAAVFADVGKAWSESPQPSSHLGVLRDLGFGLRFGQTRSAHAALLRIDFAMPFDALSGSRHPQIVVSTGETF